MRALLGILCLFASSPSDRLGAAQAGASPERMAEIGALLAAIAPGQAESETVKALPDDLDAALTAWIDVVSPETFRA